VNSLPTNSTIFPRALIEAARGWLLTRGPRGTFHAGFFETQKINSLITNNLSKPCHQKSPQECSTGLSATEMMFGWGMGTGSFRVPGLAVVHNLR
jgi:hypothetical protein